jgi:hypothetical protein
MSDSADQPTVHHVAEKLRAYRMIDGNYVGGVVHIVVDDGNVEQAHADWCLDQARANGDPADVDIATLITDLSDAQRRELADLDTYPR